MNNVQILLSSYNGEKYIEKQIESILQQEDVEVSILIRDDGSTDGTIDILKKLSRNPKITYYEGKNIGPAKSFMELINKSGEFDYYAFSDQDDIWDSKKVINAIKKLENLSNQPALYISALEIVDENLNTQQIKKIDANFTFESELIKNFATGCTEVYNKKLCSIIKKYNPNFIMMHDSWICRVCYAIGGHVIVDDKAYIKYRQHSNNVLGYKDNGIQKIKKQFKIAFKDKINIRVNISKELKSGYEAMLTEETKKVINHVINYKKNIKSKIWLLFNKKFRTNNFVVNMQMIIAILLNKF